MTKPTRKTHRRVTRPPFEIVDLNAVTGVPCPCGTSRRAFAQGSNRPCSIHVVNISIDARPHYHKRLTEIYYILEGKGHLELNGKLHAVRPGMAVLIRPGTRHRAVPGRRPMRVLNVVIPRFDQRDEWFE